MRTIEWKETWSVRRLVYGSRYIPYLLHRVVIWDLWAMGIAMLYKWPVGAPPWSREGASAIGVAILWGTATRLTMEPSTRTIRWSDKGFYTALIGKFDCPLSAISDLQFSEVDDEWSRAEFYVTKKFGRRKKYLIGIPRRAVAKVKALFELESDVTSDEFEEINPRSMRSMAHSAFFFALYWKILGWFMICGAVITGVDNILFAKDLKTALEGEAVAVVGGLIGVAVIRQKIIMRWYLRLLTRKRNQGDDRLE